MVMIRSYERAMTNNERSGARVGCRGGPCRLVSRELKSLKKINASRSEG